MTTKITIAIVIVAFLAVFFTLRQGDQYKTFMKTAQKTNAVLLKKEERIIEPKTQRKQYWITYNYDTRGNTHTVQEYLEYEDLWKDLREGQSVQVYYNKDKPSESYFAPAIERRVGIANKMGAR